MVHAVVLEEAADAEEGVSRPHRDTLPVVLHAQYAKEKKRVRRLERRVADYARYTPEKKARLRDSHTLAHGLSDKEVVDHFQTMLEERHLNSAEIEDELVLRCESISRRRLASECNLRGKELPDYVLSANLAMDKRDAARPVAVAPSAEELQKRDEAELGMARDELEPTTVSASCDSTSGELKLDGPLYQYSEQGGFDDKDLLGIRESGQLAIPNTCYKIPAALAQVLRAYQAEAINDAIHCFTAGRGCMFGHVMGTGKTLTTLALASVLNVPTLVACPIGLIRTWESECLKFGHLLNVSTATSVDLWARRCRTSSTLTLLVCGYAEITAAVKSGELIIPPNALVVVDECHLNCRNASNRFSKVVRELRTRWILFLTGTPIPNKLEDLYNQIDLLAPGLFGESLAAFRRDFIVPIVAGFTGGATRAESYEKDAKIASLRRTLNASRTLHIQSELLQSSCPTRDIVLHHQCPPHDMSSTLLLASRETKEAARGVKRDLARAIIAAVLDETAESIVVFSTHVMPLAELRDLVPGPLISGDLTTPKRIKAVAELDSRATRVLYSTFGVGSVGLDLTAATRIILLDATWTAAESQQAIARCQRPPQTTPVHVYRLVADSTPESCVYLRSHLKEQTANAFLLNCAIDGTVEGPPEEIRSAQFPTCDAACAIRPAELTSMGVADRRILDRARGTGFLLCAAWHDRGAAPAEGAVSSACRAVGAAASSPLSSRVALRARSAQEMNFGAFGSVRRLCPAPGASKQLVQAHQHFFGPPYARQLVTPLTPVVQEVTLTATQISVSVYCPGRLDDVPAAAKDWRRCDCYELGFRVRRGGGRSVTFSATFRELKPLETIVLPLRRACATVEVSVSVTARYVASTGAGPWSGRTPEFATSAVYYTEPHPLDCSV